VTLILCSSLALLALLSSLFRFIIEYNITVFYKSLGFDLLSSCTPLLSPHLGLFCKELAFLGQGCELNQRWGSLEALQATSSNQG